MPQAVIQADHTTEFILRSLKLLFYLEEISEKQTGTAGSELMKGLWLPISSFNGSPSPLTSHTSTVTQMPSWQVLHSLQEGKTKRSRVRGIPWPHRWHRHQISLSSSLNRIAKGKIVILNQNTDFVTPNPTFCLWHWVHFSLSHTHTHSLLRRYHYTKIPASKRLLAHPRGVLNTVKVLPSLAKLSVSLSLNSCHFLLYLLASLRKKMRTVRPSSICNTLRRE